jgi:hypothetical protein
MKPTWKGLTCLLFAACLTISIFSPVVLASEDGGVIKKQLEQYYAENQNKPGLAERTLADAILSPANFTLRSLSVQDVVVLVFGKNPNPTADGFLQGDCVGKTDCREGTYLGVLSEGMMQAVDVLNHALERVLPYPLFFALVLIGFFVLTNSTSAEGKTRSKDYFRGILIALITIRFGHYLWILSAWIAHHFTELIWAALLDAGITPNFFLDMIWGNGSQGYEEMSAYRGLVLAVIVLSAVIMSGVLNYQYAVRSILLMVLLVTFPIVCVLSIFPSFRHSLTLWFQEFIANLFMPCAHALALGLFFLLLKYGNDGVSTWTIVAYFFGLPVVVNLFRQLIGLKEESGIKGTLGSITGLYAASNALKLFRSNRGTWLNQDPKGNGHIRQEKAGIGDGASSAGQALTLSSSVPATRLLKGVGKVAGFSLQTGGALVGGSIGMMAGQPVVGATLGALAGRGVGTTVLATGKAAKKLASTAFHSNHAIVPSGYRVRKQESSGNSLSASVPIRKDDEEP